MGPEIGMVAVESVYEMVGCANHPIEYGRGKSLVVTVPARHWPGRGKLSLKLELVFQLGDEFDNVVRQRS